MDEKEEKILLDDINQRLIEQAVRLLKYVSQEMKGETLEIDYMRSLEKSYVSNFLPGKQLSVNICYECNKVTEMRENFTLILYKLFDDSYEITLDIHSESELFSYLPVSILNGLRKSSIEKTSLEIIL